MNYGQPIRKDDLSLEELREVELACGGPITQQRIVDKVAQRQPVTAEYLLGKIRHEEELLALYRSDFRNAKDDADRRFYEGCMNNVRKKIDRYDDALFALGERREQRLAAE